MCLNSFGQDASGIWHILAEDRPGGTLCLSYVAPGRARTAAPGGPLCDGCLTMLKAKQMVAARGQHDRRQDRDGGMVVRNRRVEQGIANAEKWPDALRREWGLPPAQPRRRRRKNT